MTMQMQAARYMRRAHSHPRQKKTRGVLRSPNRAEKRSVAIAGPTHFCVTRSTHLADLRARSPGPAPRLAAPTICSTNRRYCLQSLCHRSTRHFWSCLPPPPRRSVRVRRSGLPTEHTQLWSGLGRPRSGRCRGAWGSGRRRPPLCRHRKSRALAQVRRPRAVWSVYSCWGRSVLLG
jgi:hypothetical protein